MNAYFVCKTDKSPARYRCGEEIVFHIAYRQDGVTVPAPCFRYEIAADFGFREEGTADGATGELTLRASLDRPGFVFVKVEATERDGTPCAESDALFGGAAVEIERITPTTKKPDDYDAFWAACRAELETVAPVLLSSKERPLDPEHPHHRSFDIRVACAGEAPVSGILSIPCDGKKHPARAIYQGYGVKSAWADFDDDEIQLCINAHGIDNEMPQEYYDALVEGRLRRYGFNVERNKSPYTCYFKNMMLRAAQALRYLKTLPEWDGKGLFVRGGSQGAVQSMHAAALTDGVTKIDIMVPWLCDIRAGEIGRLCGWGEFDTAAMPYFDLTLRAAQTAIPVSILAGLGDYTAPPAGVAAMFGQLRGPKELTLVQSREHVYISPEAEAFSV